MIAGNHEKFVIFEKYLLIHCNLTSAFTDIFFYLLIQTAPNSKLCMIAGKSESIYVIIIYISRNPLFSQYFFQYISVQQFLYSYVRLINSINIFRSTLKAMIVILPILGVTWLTGVLVNTSVIFSYVFAISNAFQGVLIFIMQILINAEVRSLKFLTSSSLYTSFCILSSIKKNVYIKIHVSFTITNNS